MMTTKYNAQALMGEVQKEHPSLSGYTLAVFAVQRAIEQKEAIKQEFDDFRQEVSDALVMYSPENRNPALGRFIIPKPDPLAQTLGDFDGTLWEPEDVLRFRAALEARGLEIREKNDG